MFVGVDSAVEPGKLMIEVQHGKEPIDVVVGRTVKPATSSARSALFL